MIDNEIWVGILVLTAVLYGIKWIQSKRTVTIYRISPESLDRSKKVMMAVLPLIEDGKNSLLDATRLPCHKNNIKSAAKILAYYFWKEKQHEELARVKNCFIALSRFQNQDLDSDAQERLASKEKQRFTHEIENYIRHSPYKNGKAA